MAFLRSADPRRGGDVGVRRSRAIEARVDRLAAALRARPERTLALFGHADLFHLLMERHCGRDDKWLKNAEVLRVELQ